MPTIKDIIVRKPTKEESAEYSKWPIWECQPSTFDWVYTEKETCLIIEGDVTITADQDSVSFAAGDLVIFPEGLECTWNIRKAVRKYYNFG